MLLIKSFSNFNPEGVGDFAASALLAKVRNANAVTLAASHDKLANCRIQDELEIRI